ncbi:hypothetical protein LguiA_003288 [Lonicera macranthoides]
MATLKPDYGCTVLLLLDIGKYMHKGISVWLDVPLEALAHRITSVGTNSRPLLHHGEGDTYTTTFKRLSTLWEERTEAYTNANARVSLDSMMP